MNRLHIATRDLGDWRSRLADPNRHWKRKCSAFEAAVSWEAASKSDSGLPAPIRKLLADGGFSDPCLAFAVAEHQVALAGQGSASHCDVWAVVKTAKGFLSLSVEAKAKEGFGNETLEDWLSGNGKDASKRNRQKRWECIRSALPASDFYGHVPYQLLHRCAASVIEAKRLGFDHAAMIVQAFNAPAKSFNDYAVFCDAVGIAAERGKMVAAPAVDGVSLNLGWVDCPLATDKKVCAVAQG